MISAHIFSITKRLLGISSLALLFGQPLFASMASSVDMRSSSGLNFCWSGVCRVMENGASMGNNAKMFAQKEEFLATTQSFLGVDLLSRERGEVLMLGYTPPSCSDTDADQTNNCGPGDTGDAGTRMSI